MFDPELRPFWNRLFRFDWKFGLFLLAVICIPRFWLVLHANQTGNYAPIGAIMFVSALVPFIFLTRYGTERIGIIGTRKLGMLALSIALGIAASLILYVLGKEWYSNTYQNWYVYIGQSYNIQEGMSANDRLTLFIIMATVGMTFSPIGEELFFRGIIHGSFAKSIGENKAALVDSSAFAITHLAHFGLVFTNNSWTFYPIPAIIWIASMFFISLLFFNLKKSTGLLGAICCHAGFNLGMIYCIFYLL